MNLTSSFWENRYRTNETGWDIGEASTPLVHYFESLKNKDIKILIPGCGNAYEAEHLFNNGFKNVYLIDWAQSPLNAFAKRNPHLPSNQLICGDFFELESTFDLIIEQTFFCAIDQNLRKKYVEKCYQLLAPKGKVAGLLFNRVFDKQGPPFGGTIEEYTKLFQSRFSEFQASPASNSIIPRKGNEVFFEALK